MEMIELEDDLVEIKLLANESEWAERLTDFAECAPEYIRLEQLVEGGLIAILPADCIDIVCILPGEKKGRENHE